MLYALRLTTNRLLGELRLDRNGCARGAGRCHPAPQDFGDAPRLRNATPRRVRLLGVKDLTDGADTKVVERGDAAVEKTTCALRIAGMHLEPRIDPRTDKPGPYRALMIRGITRTQIAEVARFVVCVARRQRP